MATIADRIGAASTTNAATYTTGAFTPALDDLLVMMVGITGQTATDWVITDSLGGTWTKIRRQVKAASADIMELWVRDTLVPASLMTLTYSHATGNASGVIARCYGIGGVTRAGASAVRQSSGQDNQAAAGTPAPVFGSAVLTTNVVVGTIHNATNPAALTPPTSYTELPTPDTGYATPTTGQEAVYRLSGETGTTITWGGTSASAFSSLVAEIDTSVAATDAPFPFLGGGYYPIEG